jgi:hypothetical protein
MFVLPDATDTPFDRVSRLGRGDDRQWSHRNDSVVHMLAIRVRNEVQAGEPSQLGDARHIADGRLRESRLASEQ